MTSTIVLATIFLTVGSLALAGDRHRLAATLLGISLALSAVSLIGCAAPEPPPGKILGHGYSSGHPDQTLRRVLQDEARRDR